MDEGAAPAERADPVVVTPEIQVTSRAKNKLRHRASLSSRELGASLLGEDLTPQSPSSRSRSKEPAQSVELPRLEEHPSTPSEPSKTSPRKGEKQPKVSAKAAAAAELVRTLMLEKCMSVLKAWHKYFDRGFHGCCTAQDFRQGMQALKFTGLADNVWEELDEERLDEVLLDAIDPESARLWSLFKRWCGATFESARDFILSAREAADSDPFSEVISAREFCAGLEAAGWEHGHGKALFSAMDLTDEGQLSLRDLKWLEHVVRRRNAKLVCKARFLKESHAKAAAKLACESARASFKACLRRQFGCIYHAWRRALDTEGRMILQRTELFKACRQINWKGDVRALWRALDFDAGGTTSLEELDPSCAQLIARYRAAGAAKFGGKPAAGMWAALDERGKKKLTYQQFAQQSKEQLGYDKKIWTLAKWLDWKQRGWLIEQDFSIFDVWRPPPWLVANPNHQAAAEIRRLMKSRYGHFLKAWRTVMDKDNSNSCNWHEFVHAARTLRYHGDVAGAWLVFDQDVSGSISFHEIDEGANKVLVDFKLWAIEEFGGVRSAFKSMDTDNSNELTYKEFRVAMREYGYTGDMNLLFETLDQHSDKCLQYQEVAFLDSWDLGTVEADMEQHQELQNSIDNSAEQTSILLDYKTSNPGPGAYNVAFGFGAPTARHGGSFSFTGRERRQGWLRHTKTVGPAHYELSAAAAPKRRIPSWGFGLGGGRKSAVAGWTVKAEKSPGPGSYEPAKATDRGASGPQFSMGQRWGMVVHPQQRPAMTARSQ